MNDDFYQEVADKFIFKVKKDLLYTEDDVWVKIEDNKARIGLTDFLQRRSGDVVFVESPKMHSKVKRSEGMVGLESIKVVLTVPSPLNGVIVEVNNLLKDKPEMINDDPYGKGWLVLISPSSLEKDKRHLITAEKYFDLMKARIENELKKR